jgi:hypothetical protein
VGGKLSAQILVVIQADQRSAVRARSAGVTALLPLASATAGGGIDTGVVLNLT